MTTAEVSTWPCYSEEEVEAVARVLRSGKVNYWTGDETRSFEQDFAESVETEYAIALMNGTVALELALRALDIGVGDEVIVTPRSFIASVSSVVSVGATPVFADVSGDSQNITPDSVRAVLSPRTRAIICVHLAGWACEMDEILEIARQRDLRIIEDCAQAHGASYRDQPVGGIGDVGCWSFCQDKIMTTGGEGGMVTTNDAGLWQRMWSYKDHGKSFDAVNRQQPGPGFKWVHQSFGTNWRMTEMQAAIGRIQLGRLEEWHRLRQAQSDRIEATCRASGIFRVPPVPPHVDHARYRCVVFVVPAALADGWTRDRIVQEIQQRGIPCFQGICPEIYLESVFEDTGLRPAERLPVARELGETSLTFLVHPSMTDGDLNAICAAIAEVAGCAAGY